MVRIPVSLCLFSLLLSSTAVFADGAVSVRSSAKDGYTRIVFEWPAAPSYVTDKSASSLTLKFQSAAVFKTEGQVPNKLPRITSYATPDSKTAVIGFASGQDVRHFEIGNKVIVDVRGPAAASVAAPSTPAEEKAQNKIPDKTPDKKVDIAAAAPKNTLSALAAPVTAETGLPPPQVVAAKTPAKTPEKVSATAVPAEATIIGITSTDAVGLAVFKRFGNLWIVLDVADYPLTPQISGADAKKFGSFERIALKEATAFRLAVPDDRIFRVEGGGLVWKIIADGKPSATLPTDFARKDGTDKKTGLLWPVPGARRVIDVGDPVVGDTLKVATTDSARYFSGAIRDYSEFESLRSYAGLAIESRVDDLKVTKEKDGVLIEGKDGLSVSPESDFIAARPLVPVAPSIQAAGKAPPATPAQTAKAIAAPGLPGSVTASPGLFHFADWKIGDAQAAEDNRRILMSGLAVKPDPEKAKDLLTLAKMELAYGHGPEASGYLDLAAQLLPDLATSPEYMALHGASDALAGQYEPALKNFSADALKSVPETGIWKAYTLANLEDWKQAADNLPADTSALKAYPDEVRVPIALSLTEVALRDGNLKKADEMMALAAVKDPILAYRSALDYMKGEEARQQGKIPEAEKLWSGLKDGKDDLYRAKAGLALATLQLDRKEIKPEEAIDRLEGLRYAWRGDELETAVNRKLGQTYIANNDPLKGLSTLRSAASFSPDSDQSKSINAEMASTFANLFEPNRIKNINPVDAITIYNEFSNLVPKGPDGQKIIRQLADRLADADLLPRAAGLLEKQVASGTLQGEEAAMTAIHLASIYNQDTKPDKALESLAKATGYMAAAPADHKPSLQRQIALLKAQALAEQKKPEEAFVILAGLPQNQEVLKMRADIAWKAQRWQDAADSLEALVKDKDISTSRPASDEDAETLLNWAVALYLADNRFVLANLREKYSAAMSSNPKASPFEVVTRPRQSSQLADQDTINSIIEETDIFKGFVDSSRAANRAADTRNAAQAETPAAKTVAPVAPAIPPTPPASAAAQ